MVVEAEAEGAVNHIHSAEVLTSKKIYSQLDIEVQVRLLVEVVRQQLPPALLLGLHLDVQPQHSSLNHNSVVTK